MKARLSASLIATLLVGALCASLALAAKPGGGHPVTYRGKTSQNKPIQIKGATGSLTLQQFQIRMLCHDGSLYFASVSGFEPTRVSGGRFSDKQYGSTDVVKWEGKATPKKIAGRVQVEDRLPSGTRCGSGPVRFTAKARGAG